MLYLNDIKKKIKRMKNFSQPDILNYTKGVIYERCQKMSKDSDNIVTTFSKDVVDNLTNVFSDKKRQIKNKNVLPSELPTANAHHKSFFVNGQNIGKYIPVDQQKSATNIIQEGVYINNMRDELIYNNRELITKRFNLVQDDPRKVIKEVNNKRQKIKDKIYNILEDTEKRSLKLVNSLDNHFCARNNPLINARKENFDIIDRKK